MRQSIHSVPNAVFHPFEGPFVLKTSHYTVRRLGLPHPSTSLPRPSIFQKTLLEAAALSDAIAVKGDAEAFAIEAKAKAKAEEMTEKAEAWKEYQKAAKVSMWLDAIPTVAAEVAAPLSQVIMGYEVVDPKEN